MNRSLYIFPDTPHRRLTVLLAQVLEEENYQGQRDTHESLHMSHLADCSPEIHTPLDKQHKLVDL